jgi:osmotically-inducible protein OsmY
MKKQNFKITDQELLERIHARIRWDIRVSNSDVLVQVSDGCVTLLGYFDKVYRHGAAVGIITTTEGVSQFIDKSEVVNDYYRTDQELETLVKKQLETFQLLPGENIEVVVQNGIARLRGKVYRSKLKAFAARATWELSGIKDCVNLIDLRSDTQENEMAKIIPFKTNLAFIHRLKGQIAGEI